MLALWRFFYIVINEFIFYVKFFICYHMCLKFSFYFILLLYLELIFFWVFGLISIFFFEKLKWTPGHGASTGISLMRLSPVLCEGANPHEVCPPMDSCGQRELNLDVVHETNEPCPLNQAPVGRVNLHIYIDIVFMSLVFGLKFLLINFFIVHGR